MKFCFNKTDFIEQEVSSEKVAVIGDDFSLTWQQFSDEVNEVVQIFKEEKWENLSSPVVIYGHKSARMIVSMYAMMKMNISYIPVDVVYPKDRVEKIIEIAKSEIIINTTSKCFSTEITEFHFSGNKSFYPHQNTNYRVALPKEDPLVYTIFTSGSTGEPKGVQISQSAVQSFTRWMTSSDFGFSADDTFINTAVFSFDLSIFEVMTFGALGATLLMNNKEQTANPKLLMSRIEEYKGTIWVSTPSFAFTYSRIEDVKSLRSIQYFLFCGEILPHSLAKSLSDKFPQAKIFNTYGPTEATVATTIVEINDTILSQYDPLPVGKTKMETEIIIDNEEIVIVGDNVSLGYLNNAELNDKKFTVINEKRAFRTGDKGFFQDEMLFFKGRDDDFIKLHGYRIELNEITAQLNKIEGVQQGETIALKRNDVVKKIVSLVHLKPTISLDKKAILEKLSKVLPNYMLPSDVKFVEGIPLNQNGKSDKKELQKLYLKR